MEQKILDLAHRWATSPHVDQAGREEVQKLLKLQLNAPSESSAAKLRESFYCDLAFGTGGIRAIIGQGTNRINRTTIRRTTQAFANALIDAFGMDIAICVGFDCRHHSALFAQEAARVMASNRIRVHLFEHMTPTPLLSYAVRYHRAQGGIMITASHNPRNYNGYKAYWDDGCQVSPPHDRAIIDHYQKLDPLVGGELIGFEQGRERGHIVTISQQCADDYYQMIQQQCLNPDICQKHGGQFPIAFTPLHGTGGEPVTRALRQIGFDHIHVASDQYHPDPDFPTVTRPNPEEPTALKAVIELMEAKKLPLALATDPDTDRLGVVVAHAHKSHMLNGNQIGLLLLHYILRTKQARGSLGENPLLVKTIVTSDLLAQVARAFGCTVENTLTGFKWICGKLRDYERQQRPYDFVLGTEESFGYLSHDHCRDKDGVNACALMAEVALHHHLAGRSLVDALDDIYRQYGYACEGLLSLYYQGVEGGQKIERIMHYFRQVVTGSAVGQPLLGQKIVRVEDYLQQQAIDLSSGERDPIALPASNILGLHFEGNIRLYLRPSGTEPKLKFYIMIAGGKGELVEQKRQATRKIAQISQAIKALCAGI